MADIHTPFTRDAQISIPLICGAMYPCSNPELVAAASRAGGLGVIQPVSLVYAHGYDLARGIDLIQGLTDNPVGFNAIVEKSSSAYEARMENWIAIALEKGIRFFITALGNPSRVVEMVHGYGGKVYHDVTELKWAQKAVDAGVDGLICVNNRAGGHAGAQTPDSLYKDLTALGLPLVCAGGIGHPDDFTRALELGYAGVQLGTRFIASRECTAHPDYKAAILGASASDIVLTERISGVPVSIINTPYVMETGTRAGALAKKLLRHPRFKHYVRMAYTLKSVWQLKRASLQGSSYRDYFQAGKSVSGIQDIQPVETIVRDFASAWRHWASTTGPAL
ncbi:MAG: nitronate monooxygenase [Desulfobacterales bacterium]|nr:nitronate monooxygenase [Desulfobacterales bacterium]